jgi:hypothetical protein
MRLHWITAFYLVAIGPAWAAENEGGEEGEPSDPSEKAEAEVEPPPPPPPVTPPGPPIHPLNAYYGDGFNLSSENGDFWLNIGLEARVQASVADTNSIDAVRAPPPARFAVQPRSLQLFLRGRVFRNLEFGLGLGIAGEPDRTFDMGQVTLAYASYLAAEWFQIQVGALIVPFGLEASSYFYPTRTIERSIVAESIAPYRDVGAIISGRVFRSLSYYVGAISGTPPNVVTSQAGTFTLFAGDEQVDGVARIAFSLQDAIDGPFQGFGIGASFQIGVQPFLLSGARALFLSRLQPATLFDSASRGLRYRVGGDLVYAVGPFGLRAEGMYEVAQRDRVLTPLGQVSPDGTEDASDIVRFGAYGEVGVFVFGSLEEGGLEPVVKYEFFGAESKNIVAPLNPVRVHAITGGLTYYFRPNVRIQLDGVFIDVRRYGTVEDPDPAPASYLDNRRSWLIQSQFQVWFL